MPNIWMETIPSAVNAYKKTFIIYLKVLLDCFCIVFLKYLHSIKSGLKKVTHFFVSVQNYSIWQLHLAACPKTGLIIYTTILLIMTLQICWQYCSVILEDHTKKVVLKLHFVACYKMKKNINYSFWLVWFCLNMALFYSLSSYHA